MARSEERGLHSQVVLRWELVVPTPGRGGGGGYTANERGGDARRLA